MFLHATSMTLNSQLRHLPPTATYRSGWVGNVASPSLSFLGFLMTFPSYIFLKIREVTDTDPGCLRHGRCALHLGMPSSTGAQIA